MSHASTFGVTALLFNADNSMVANRDYCAVIGIVTKRVCCAAITGKQTLGRVQEVSEHPSTTLIHSPHRWTTFVSTNNLLNSVNHQGKSTFGADKEINDKHWVRIASPTYIP